MYQVLIRPLVESDAKISYKWRNDKDIWTHTGSKPDREITVEMELEWIKLSLANPTQKRFAIMVDGMYVGNIQLTNIDMENKKAEYHIFIGEKSAWGKGIAGLASYQLLYYAKEVLGLDEVYLSVKETNIPAVKLYKKSRFVQYDKADEWIKMSRNLTELDSPQVSVFVMVYNHENFLKDCLEGILKQKCNFSFDIVVGEDSSTDNSRAVLLEYQRNYPGKFKLLLHPHNIGAFANQEIVLNNCTGKYVAICEGDDFWTDERKLQKQVDFLENNPDYGLVHTDYKAVDENNNPLQQWEPKYIESHTDGEVFELLLKKKYNIATLTVLFKRNLFCGFADELISLQLKMTDYPMWLEFSKKMKVGYINEVTASYRMLQNSASHSDNVEKIIAFNLNSLHIRTYFADKYGVKLNVNKETARIYSNVMRDCFLHNKSLASKYYAKMVQTYFPSIFNPRPLLFLLGCNYLFFSRLIYKIQDSGPVFLKKHFLP